MSFKHSSDMAKTHTHVNVDFHPHRMCNSLICLHNVSHPRKLAEELSLLSRLLSPSVITFCRLLYLEHEGQVFVGLWEGKGSITFWPEPVKRSLLASTFSRMVSGSAQGFCPLKREFFFEIVRI